MTVGENLVSRGLKFVVYSGCVHSPLSSSHERWRLRPVSVETVNRCSGIDHAVLLCVAWQWHSALRQMEGLARTCTAWEGINPLFLAPV